MDKIEAVNKLVKYKLLVSQYFDIDNLILFGSYAKGNQGDDSDIDVAVIVNSLETDYFSYAP